MNKVQKEHRHIFANFKELFKNFLTLVIMQLKEQFSFSFKADKKGTITKLILFGVLFIAITATIAVVIFLLGYLRVLGNGVLPVTIFNVFLYLVLILSTLSCIHRMTKSLFFSEDNQVLLTYPVNSGIIFLSKITVFFIVELVRNFLMIVPLCLAYGIINGLPFYFYFWLILVFLIISFIPVALGAVLSIPYMYILSFFKKSQYIPGILAMLALISLAVFLFIGLSKMPTDLKILTNWATVYYPQVENFTRTVEDYSGPLFYFALLIFGYMGYRINADPRSLNVVVPQTGIVLLCFVGIIVLGLVLGYLLAKPLFFKMATKPFEYQKILISHSYKIDLSKDNIHEAAFRPMLKYPISKKDKEGIVNKLSRLLRKVNHEEKLFLRQQVAPNRILKFLNKYAKNLKFEQVNKSEINDFGFLIHIRNGVPFLVLVKGIKDKTASAYDPNYLGAKNHKLHYLPSIFLKEVLLDLRTPGRFLSNFMLFIITPLSIALLNAIFGAINTSFQGESFTIMFNVLIIMLIALASNVSVASIYSREGKASYMLKAMPIDYMKALTSKLIVRGVIVVSSLLVTSIIYSSYSNIHYLRPDLLFFSFAFVYLGHLLWSAELDFMNPQDRLYSEVGANVTNPNEVISSVLTFIISFVFMGITFFLVSREIRTAFYQILIISFIFFAARLALFIFKIKGYGTSRAERRDN